MLFENENENEIGCPCRCFCSHQIVILPPGSVVVSTFISVAASLLVISLSLFRDKPVVYGVVRVLFGSAAYQCPMNQ